MSGYIPVADRHQVVLFPETLEEYIAAENPVRVIDAFVAQLDLAALGVTRAAPAATGRPGYDPRLLLKLYVYGYLHRIRSSRRLEREAQRNVELLWLLGRAVPDHKTIADFRAQHPKALRGVFREFTVVCRSLGLFGQAFVGIDGTKLRAVNAKDQSFTPAELRRALQRIDAHIREYLSLLATTDQAEAPTRARDAAGGEDLASRLARLTERQTAYRQLLATLDATGATQVTLTDPESRRMKVKQGSEVCYNAQLAVDEQHHLIVAAEVTNAPTDVQQLSGMALAAQAALDGATFTVAADAGYHHPAELARCVAAGLTPAVPQPQRGKGVDGERFTKADFTYLPDGDAYRCPRGAMLPFQFTTTRGVAPQRYYYDFAACAGCPLRARCVRTTDPTRGRRIKRGPHDTLLTTMAAMLRADRTLMHRRKSLVEHPFGTIKRTDDGGYLLLKGLEKVGGEFSLMALAYNLRRAIALVGVPALLAALLRGPGRPRTPLPTG